MSSSDHKKPTGIKATFRGPTNYWYDVADSKWPIIRKKNPVSGQPFIKGEGYIIYDFMVNHQFCSTLPGHDAWRKSLYPNPLIVDLPLGPAPCLDSYEITTSCKRFAKLWRSIVAVNVQLIKRPSEEIMEASWLEMTVDDDEEGFLPGGGRLMDTSV